MILKFRISSGKPVYEVESFRRLEQFYTQNEGKYVYMTISEEDPIRAIEDNAYYWKCIVQPCADFLGYTPEEMHAIFKHLCLPRQFKILKFKDANGVIVEEEIEITKSTKNLTRKQFQKYKEDCKRVAAENGVIIQDVPTPTHQ